MKENVSLILEECRHAIASNLHRKWDQSRYHRGLKLRLEFCETQTTKRSRHCIFSEEDLECNRHFSATEFADLMRYGAVAELVSFNHGRNHRPEILLGTISYPLTSLLPYDRQIKICCRLDHLLYPCPK